MLPKVVGQPLPPQRPHCIPAVHCHRLQHLHWRQWKYWSYRERKEKSWVFNKLLHLSSHGKKLPLQYLETKPSSSVVRADTREAWRCASGRRIEGRLECSVSHHQSATVWGCNRTADAGIIEEERGGGGLHFLLHILSQYLSLCLLSCTTFFHFMAVHSLFLVFSLSLFPFPCVSVSPYLSISPTLCTSWSF